MTADLDIMVVQSVGGFAPSGLTGGGTIHAIGLAQSWHGAGAKVTYVTNSSDSGVERYRKVDRVVVLPSAQLFGKTGSGVSLFVESLLNPLIQASKLGRILAEVDGRKGRLIVVSPSLFLADVLVAAALCRKAGARGVVYCHHLVPSPFWHPFRRGSLTRVVVSWVQSRISLALAKVFGFSPTINNPTMLATSGWRFDNVVKDVAFLDDRTFESSATADSGRQPNSACFIGRLTAPKGVIDLLRTWTIVTGHLPDATLYLAGTFDSQSFKRKVLKTAGSPGLSNSVKVLGPVSDQERSALLVRSSVLAFPSWEEGWSLTVLEAAWYGVLPIVYRLPAYEYLGELAIRVDVGDTLGMANAILSVFSNEQVHSFRRHELHNVAARFRRDRVASDHLDHFKKMLEPLPPNGLANRI